MYPAEHVTITHIHGNRDHLLQLVSDFRAYFHIEVYSDSAHATWLLGRTLLSYTCWEGGSTRAESVWVYVETPCMGSGDQIGDVLHRAVGLNGSCTPRQGELSA